MKLIVLSLSTILLFGQAFADGLPRRTLNASFPAQKSLGKQHRHSSKRRYRKRRRPMIEHASEKEPTGSATDDLRTPPIEEPLDPGTNVPRPAHPEPPTPQSPQSKDSDKDKSKKRRLQPPKIKPEIIP
jgi:hypothetical protein